MYTCRSNNNDNKDLEDILMSSFKQAVGPKPKSTV